MKLIVGLGNPGPAYRNTRHNVGFEVLDGLAEALGVSFAREKYRGQIAEARSSAGKVLLLKPMTFMNDSGESVAKAARNRVNEPGDILVVYDEAELPVGKLRIRKSGSAGAHNGMKSVIERLGTSDVPRLRVGVGREPEGGARADHVLGKFLPDERKLMRESVERAVQACLRSLETDIDTVMNEFN